MRFDELLAADEHSTRSATGVIDSPFVRCQHLDQNADDVRWRVELSALLALRTGKLRKEVFVDPPQNVLGTISRAAKTKVANEVYQLTKPLLVQTGTTVVFRQNAL